MRLDLQGRRLRDAQEDDPGSQGRGKLSLLRHLKGAKLRKGAVVQLRVTRPATIGRIGKWQIRAPKIPKITRTCVRPGAKKTSRCPR